LYKGRRKHHITTLLRRTGTGHTIVAEREKRRTREKKKGGKEKQRFPFYKKRKKRVRSFTFSFEPRGGKHSREQGATCTRERGAIILVQTGEKGVFKKTIEQPSLKKKKKVIGFYILVTAGKKKKTGIRFGPAS